MNFKLKLKILECYGHQCRLARECGRNDNWISRIITGRQRPDEEEMKMIAGKLGIQNIEEYFYCTQK